MKQLPIMNGAVSPAVRDEILGTKRRPVVLIGFQNQGNLGMDISPRRFARTATKLRSSISRSTGLILERVKFLDPILVGFSLIFQFYITQFSSLIDKLRDGGIDCHFTMGGHFPSLSYEEALAHAPNLDSVVRFEGELTLLELVETLHRDDDWRGLQGIAYRQTDGSIVCNTLRPLIESLDILPLPDREFKPMSILGHDIMPLIASRGCSRKCSFCSIHTFYRAVPGKIVRLRQIKNVVDEMRQLYEERNSKIFLFQDDDFRSWDRCGESGP
jgi:radical SAM superfamily enzyme YgiQ (UPF0313 family)